MTQIKEIVAQIEKFAPKELAEEGDPVGLQLGNLENETKRVLVTLDVRPEIVAEAIAQNVDFIFSHHPVMFRPAKNLDLSNPQNQMYADLLKHDITVYSAHTNVDKAPISMNNWLANIMALTDIAPFALLPTQDGELVGIGRKGKLTKPVTVLELVKQVKEKFNLTGLRFVTKDPNQLVSTVGIIGGDGGKFYPEAVNEQLDVLITGDVYYHTAHDMLAENLTVIDPGHHIEAIFKEEMAQNLTKWSKENNWDVEIIQSKISTDPYRFA